MKVNWKDSNHLIESVRCRQEPPTWAPSDTWTAPGVCCKLTERENLREMKILTQTDSCSLTKTLSFVDDFFFVNCVRHAHQISQVAKLLLLTASMIASSYSPSTVATIGGGDRSCWFLLAKHDNQQLFSTHCMHQTVPAFLAIASKTIDLNAFPSDTPNSGIKTARFARLGYQFASSIETCKVQILKTFLCLKNSNPNNSSKMKSMVSIFFWVQADRRCSSFDFKLTYLLTRLSLSLSTVRSSSGGSDARRRLSPVLLRLVPGLQPPHQLRLR